MVAAAPQPEGPLEHTDPTLDPRPEPGCTAEGRPLLPRPPLRTALARFGDGHALHPSLGGVLLIRRGAEGPVRRGGVGWVSELELMVVQACRELCGVGWIAVQDHVACHQAAVHL